MPGVQKLFRPSQVYTMAMALLEEERALAAQRRDRARRRAKISHAIRVTDAIAKHFNMSGKQLEKIIELCRAAEADPERFGPLRDEMDREGVINGPYRKLKRAQDEARLLGLEAVAGRFRTLCLDPPWEDESISDSQRPPYATMSLAEIRALPIDQWQLDQGHIYVHAPGPFVAIAISLIEAWGYQYKTLITWKKSRWSMGRYFRTQAEYIAFGVRGGLMTRRGDVANHFEGPVGDHSEKPEAFYDLVRAQSFPPYGEGFQIRPRPDFLNLYQPRAAIAVAAE